MKVLYAGTFNPFTYGHDSVVRAAVQMGFDVVVGVGKGEGKAEGGKVEVVRKCLPEKIEVVKLPTNMYTAKFAKSLGCDALIRGIRNASDLEAEMVLARENEDIAEIPTLFIPSNRNYGHVSSTFVKKLVGPNGWIGRVEQYLPRPAFLDFCADYLRKLGVGDDIIAVYSQPHRQYHTVVHLVDCLEKFEEVKHLMNKPELVRIALLMHDYVYEIGATDNEEKSAAMVHTYYHAPTRELILATKHHDLPPQVEYTSYNDMALMLDIDMSILASERYDSYLTDIYEEYNKVPPEIFRKGRKAFLEELLKKPRIFHSEYFYKKYEEQARNNIKHELSMLHFHPDIMKSLVEEGNLVKKEMEKYDV